MNVNVFVKVEVSFLFSPIMAYQQVAVELVRDGPYTPWGFRMTGGADIGTPLVIQKVRNLNICFIVKYIFLFFFL